jgi:hypothetical protein
MEIATTDLLSLYRGADEALAEFKVAAEAEAAILHDPDTADVGKLYSVNDIVSAMERLWSSVDTNTKAVIEHHIALECYYSNYDERESRDGRDDQSARTNYPRAGRRI